MGDWNEDTSNRTVAAELEKEFGVVNVFKQKFPEENVFKTHIEGSQRIDYVLTLPWVADAISLIVYEPFKHRLKGDHRGFTSTSTKSCFLKTELMMYTIFWVGFFRAKIKQMWINT